MQPTDLLAHVSRLLWPAAEQMVRSVQDPLGPLQVEPGVTDPALQGRLLEALTNLPTGNPFLALLHEILGDLPGPPLQWHGWERAAGAERGIALVVTEGDERGVLALSPGPVVDIVVTANASLSHVVTSGPWEARVTVSTAQTWQASLTEGAPAVAAGGTADLQVTRGPASVGAAPGPNAGFAKLLATLHVDPTKPVTVGATIQGFRASVLPEPIQRLLGLGDRPSDPIDLALALDRAEGIRFAGHGLRLPLPSTTVKVPGLSLRGFALELTTDPGGLVLKPSFDAQAMLPALPLRLMLTQVGVDLPLSLTDGGFKVGAVVPRPPSGLGVEIAMPPVSGGGIVEKVGDDKYRGLLDVDLGVVGVQAMGILVLPGPDRPLSFLVLLTASFPKPGIQLGFGFALDAVGGLLGVNRRVDDERLRGLVTDGNADRIMFPENALARAGDILDSLDECFPVQRGQFVIGPMLQINWGGRIVTVSAAVILELPSPVRLFLLGRIVVAIPDPLVPIVRFQATLLGRFDPQVPSIDLLLSLTGSYVAGIPVSGDMYLLVRGGSNPVFVLSAGGFHPQYVRPAGVPALRRVAMDLSGGFLGLRAEAYLALTSNSLQFGAMVSLDATIAGCGVEGYLGLDAMFVWEPRIAFSVRIQAGVAVLAFGHRLASVALQFTLEGPGAWHAFGTGSISILWWDVDLDFDERWGTSPELTKPPPDIVEVLRPALRLRDAWSVGTAATTHALQLTDDAQHAVSAGDVALPDSKLRMSQPVVPLDIGINRFHRLTVPDQTWQIKTIKLRANDNDPHPTPVTDDFVPGEFFAMTQDEQLGSPASRNLKSGVELTPDTVDFPADFAAADDGYETDYIVEDGWFPPAVTRPRLVLVIARYRLEAFSRPLLAAERIGRWRLEQAAFVGSRPTVVMR